MPSMSRRHSLASRRKSHTKVQACAEDIRGSAGAKDRMEARYRQAKETKRGEKGSEQS